MTSFIIDTSGGIFKQEVPLTVDLTMQIANLATGAHDDIKAASGSNNNFEFQIQLTDRDLQTDATADTSIPSITPSFNDENLRKSALEKGKDTPQTVDLISNSLSSFSQRR